MLSIAYIVWQFQFMLHAAAPGVWPDPDRPAPPQFERAAAVQPDWKHRQPTR